MRGCGIVSKDTVLVNSNPNGIPSNTCLYFFTMFETQFAVKLMAHVFHLFKGREYWALETDDPLVPVLDQLFLGHAQEVVKRRPVHVFCVLGSFNCRKDFSFRKKVSLLARHCTQ